MISLKHSLIATVLGTALCATATGAMAQGFGAGNWYAKGFGGATWPSGEKSDVSQRGTFLGTADLDYDTGYTLGVAVGYDFRPNIAMELEYAYREADLTGDYGGDTRSNSFMLNAVYKFNDMGAMGQFTPYIGGGLGGAGLDIKVDDFGTFSQDTLFAYQVFGGVEYAMTPEWSLLGEVRWFGTDSGHPQGPDDTEVDTSFETFDLLIGASYKF